MTVSTDQRPSIPTLVSGLKRREAYKHEVASPVEVHETHISIVFLAGDFAYKIKKPIKTDFLDYSTLELRHHFCREELRLDGRYSSDLYLEVVPITLADKILSMDGDGEPVEYAVKMRRFPKEALLSERLEAGRLSTDDVIGLAETVAHFHQSARIVDDDHAKGWPDFLVRNIHQIIDKLKRGADQATVDELSVLHNWSNSFFTHHLDDITNRIEDGFVRECHGDLHLANLVYWGGRLIPFDGIEFNEQLRKIDVLSDAGFVAMDLAARGHLDLSRSFINAYLECTGDYHSLPLLRLFLFYRSLVRAITALMRSDRDDVNGHIDLATRFTRQESPRLWITHGVSGSGKTTFSETVVQRHGAIRIRSDRIRKQMFGLLATERPSAELAKKMYCDEANERTYRRLIDLAGNILQSGYPVIVDATFLKAADRQRFHRLAEQLGASFAILDCHTDEDTIRQRVVDRMARDNDASDADLGVLEYQLTHREPLSSSEQTHVIDVPEMVRVAEHM